MISGFAAMPGSVWAGIIPMRAYTCTFRPDHRWTWLWRANTRPPAPADLAVQLDECMAELAAGAGWAAMEMAVDEERSTEDIIHIEGREVARPASRSEPPVGEKHRTRMVVDIDGELQPVAQDGG